MKKAIQDLIAMVVFAVAFTALFILGHLAVYHTLPRWK